MSGSEGTDPADEIAGHPLRVPGSGRLDMFVTRRSTDLAGACMRLGTDQPEQELVIGPKDETLQHHRLREPNGFGGNRRAHLHVAVLQDLVLDARRAKRLDSECRHWASLG